MATLTAHGVTYTMAYDDAGATRRLTGISDTLGRTQAYGYDVAGNVTSTSDGVASASFVFDANNRLITSLDALNNTTTFSYADVHCGCTDEDRVTAIHTPDLLPGQAWTMDYGTEGRLAAVTDPEGRAESYDYETTGELKSVVDRLGRMTSMTHNQLGRLLAISDTASRAHGRTYPIPGGGTWTGANMLTGSSDGTAAPTGVATALPNGTYQVGLTAYPTRGDPAGLEFYRDATFELTNARVADYARRPSQRRDRAGQSIPSIDLHQLSGGGTNRAQQWDYNPRTSAPVLADKASVNGGSATFTQNADYDDITSNGFGYGVLPQLTETLTRDTGGRVTQASTSFGTSSNVFTFNPAANVYVYAPNGRVSRFTDPDGVHDVAYDSRGLVHTVTVQSEGVYTFEYDAAGRNSLLTYPDGHTRAQTYDPEGRLASRCYQYATTTRCYGATYDAAGNPTTLSDPEGTDTLSYDGLDRLVQDARVASGLPDQIDNYTYNALGALKTNAGTVLDDQRPKLAGGGTADAAIPNTLSGQAVTLNPVGYVTSLRGVTLTYDQQAQLQTLQRPVGSITETESYWHDGAGRLMARWRGQPINGTTYSFQEFYQYEGANIAGLYSGTHANPPLIESWLHDGVDHPLRVNVRGAPNLIYYYEVDLTGNVRRLMRPGGSDAGGYRYTAFGAQMPPDATTPAAQINQPLRWKGRVFTDFVAGAGLYDVRARMWSPEMGSFTAIDEYAFHDRRSTLWGWPGQNPVRWRDASGHTFGDLLGDPKPGGVYDQSVGAYGNDRSREAVALGAAGGIALVVGLGGADEALAAVVFGSGEAGGGGTVGTAVVGATLAAGPAVEELEEGGSCPVPPPDRYGPFIHGINKGGLDEIVRDQELIASEARSVAGGESAVRAYSSPLDQLSAYPSTDFVEFSTDVAPTASNPGQASVSWSMDPGASLEIQVSRIAHTDGSVTIFP